MTNVFISIINYNGEKDTLECLRSIEKIPQKDIKLSVVVIDNASKTRFSVPKDEFKKINLKVIRTEENLGFSGGQNEGIIYSLENGADYVVVLNNDTFVDPNLVKELLKGFEDDKHIGVVSPKIYFARDHEFHKDRYTQEDLGKVIWYAGATMDWKNVIGHHRGVDEVDKGKFDEISHTGFATGCCMMIKREVINQIGLFDHNYFLYYEDADYSMRAKAESYKIAYIPKAVVWHKNAGSSGGSGSKLQDYYITRNRLLFAMKYAPFRSKLSVLKESFMLLGRGRDAQKKGVLDFYLRKFGKGSFGT